MGFVCPARAEVVAAVLVGCEMALATGYVSADVLGYAPKVVVVAVVAAVAPDGAGVDVDVGVGVVGVVGVAAVGIVAVITRARWLSRA